GGTLAGDDLDPSDIDRIVTLDPDFGGNDRITTGAGDDVVITGEDGELWVGASVPGSTAVAEHQVADTTKGDWVLAGNGNNVVLGDSGAIYAAAANAPNFNTQPLTYGVITSIATTLGGNDTITTGIGKDIVIGGVGNDVIDAHLNETATVLDGDNIVIGDNGFVDWTAAERTQATPSAGDDTDPSDIDRVSSFAPTNGGNDTITTGAGYDLIIGGTGRYRVVAAVGRGEARD